MTLDLDALAALCDAATPAPWTVEDFGTGDFAYGDARFIAAARTAMPELLAEVRRLRAECRRLALDPAYAEDVALHLQVGSAGRAALADMEANDA